MEGGKRPRACSSSESSFDRSTGELSATRKSELLKKAKKKARKQQVNHDPSMTITAHFASVPKAKTGVDVNIEGQAETETMGSADDKITLGDVMGKLCDMEKKLTQVNTVLEELKSQLFDLKQENEKTKQDLRMCQEECEKLKADAGEAKHMAEIATKAANDLEQYGRRNNIRIYGLVEPERESADQCEEAALKVFNEKLGLRVNKCDIEAAHRLGPRGRTRPQGGQPYYRPVIVRFVSRKTAEAVLKDRRKLKGTPVVITEDLTAKNYRLLTLSKDHSRVDDAWSSRGSIYAKALGDGRIRKILSETDLERLPVPPPSASTPTGDRRQRRRQHQQGGTSSNTASSMDSA